MTLSNSPVLIHLLSANRIFLAGLIGAWWCHGAAYANSAMSWVPAYEIEDSVNALQTDLGGGRTVAHTINRIALQFWVPIEGTLTLDKRV